MREVGTSPTDEPIECKNYVKFLANSPGSGTLLYLEIGSRSEGNDMIQETNRLETLSKPATRMEYHTERVITLEMSSVFSNTLVAVALILGIAFVCGMFLGH
jgi:hypothetical protein